MVSAHELLQGWTVESYIILPSKWKFVLVASLQIDWLGKYFKYKYFQLNSKRWIYHNKDFNKILNSILNKLDHAYNTKFEQYKVSWASHIAQSICWLKENKWINF